MRALRIFCLAALAALGAHRAAAQTATGGIRGFVKDDTGAVLVGVTVEAASPARIGGAAVEVTDAQGLYRFDNLPPGEYSVLCSLQGFSSVRREGLRVEVGRTIQVDVALTVFWVVGLINAFNLMDNMDGSCATVTIVAAGGAGLVAALEGRAVVAGLAFGLAGAAAGRSRAPRGPGSSAAWPPLGRTLARRQVSGRRTNEAPRTCGPAAPMRSR